MPATTAALRPPSSTFSPDLIRFFEDLKGHNNREWFQANKARYEASVREPCLAFIRAVGPPLLKISPHVVADPRPVGGSLFRIHRDVRFSKDKAPYKNHGGLHFSHRDTTEECHYPGFYLHLEPGDSGAWAGMWRPNPPAIQGIREAMAKNPQEWRRITRGFERHGERLKRVPTGFDAGHALAEELKWKDFLVGRAFSDAEIAARDFRDRFVAACRALAPFNAFLAKATGARW